MGVAAHLILGAREEPFLPALLASLDGVAGMLLVNDNAPGASPHEEVLAQSTFGRAGKLVVDRTAFSGFADARNVCLRLHAHVAAGDWVAFVDADEVHGEGAARIASRLDEVPKEIAFVDGYTWHFFQSFAWFTSIERRMMFFRFGPEVRWRGLVHEQLLGLDGGRIALPYVYAHYGHTLEPRRHAEKGRHYSALGAPGNVLREEELRSFDIAQYFAPVYHLLMRFVGEHPAAAAATLARLGPALEPFHALTERVARRQSPLVKARNAVRRLNYELRWRGRALNPLARRLLQGPGAPERRT